jgi:hypothetical protein
MVNVGVISMRPVPKGETSKRSPKSKIGPVVYMVLGRMSTVPFDEDGAHKRGDLDEIQLCKFNMRMGKTRVFSPHTDEMFMTTLECVNGSEDTQMHSNILALVAAGAELYGATHFLSSGSIPVTSTAANTVMRATLSYGDIGQLPPGARWAEIPLAR